MPLKPPISVQGAVFFPVGDPAQHFMMGKPFLGFSNRVASDVVQYQFMPELVGGA